MVSHCLAEAAGAWLVRQWKTTDQGLQHHSGEKFKIHMEIASLQKQNTSQIYILLTCKYLIFGLDFKLLWYGSWKEIIGFYFSDTLTCHCVHMWLWYIFCFQNLLFYKTLQDPSGNLTVINTETLEEQGTYRLEGELLKQTMIKVFPDSLT